MWFSTECLKRFILKPVDFFKRDYEKSEDFKIILNKIKGLKN